ncbi:P-loop containing nucleoside triphosphate hydrolase protein [Xylariaceae sp. FL1272]|nr:P-loop containing nucleoside triphosphate hydrolase protein [Xylariaceae sp. FL1272]
MPFFSNPRWLLLSDIHFRQRDLERTKKTAEWVLSLTRRTPGISRVVVCGDVLTSRSMQPTAVLSAAYRFLSELSSSVPHVNVILGNHDLAYRRDYGTTALEALNIPRLRPFVSVHDQVCSYDWDGRRVLVLPFREDQSELTTAVANLEAAEASDTVAFAHLAINRAVTQRHVIRSDNTSAHSVRYRGLTGPDHFAQLARTFTGHFHSHQTILQTDKQALPTNHKDRLKGSVTYLGSPLQLTWADLHDESRGVVLLDPVTLEHELIVNPNAVGYISVNEAHISGDETAAEAVRGKHVMVTGKLTQYRYWTARDKLLALGAKSVREWRPTPPALLIRSEFNAHNTFGSSVPASDREVALSPAQPPEALDPLSDSPQNVSDEPAALAEDQNVQSKEVDLVDSVRDYIQSLDSEAIDALDANEASIIQLGQRLVQASNSDIDVTYKTLLDSTHYSTPRDESNPAQQVFVARPTALTISNFLGIQQECAVDFESDLGRGLTFVVGANGSGKSTLIEAIVWCQFGRTLRRGLSVSDVVNDVYGKDCKVSLTFSNGYTITRYRKHKVFGTRVIVSLHGIEQPHFEHGEARATQLAIDELLGIDYEEFIKTVVLGHESAASFLSSTPTQRHDLIESTLNLSKLDTCANLCRKTLKEIDTDITALRSQQETTKGTVGLIQARITSREGDVTRLRTEIEEIRNARDSVRETPNAPERGGEDDANVNTNGLSSSSLQGTDESRSGLSERLNLLKTQIRDSQEAVHEAQSAVKEIDIRDDVRTRQSQLEMQIHQAQERCQTLRRTLSYSESPGLTGAPIAEHIHSIHMMVYSLNRTVSWLRKYALTGMNYLTRDNLGSGGRNHFVGIGLMSLVRIVLNLEQLGQRMASSSKGFPTDVDIDQTKEELGAAEMRLSVLLDKKNEVCARVAIDRGIDEEHVLAIAANALDTDANEAQKNLTASLHHLYKLLEEQNIAHGLQSRYQQEKALQLRTGDDARHEDAVFESQLSIKQLEVSTYLRILEEEKSTLEQEINSQNKAEAELQSIVSRRALFAFWEEALSKRKTKSATTSTFRGYVLNKSLEQLNTVASSILVALYENTRHARELTTGMLRTMIEDADDEPENTSRSSRPALLDKTLSVSKTLSYAKRSGGERKRIDLAVFFALVQIAQAHSAHRARYILVDEAFDSLDAAGQDAVVRWCSQLMARTDFQLVVTHSEHLTSARTEPEGSDDDVESRFSVLFATMTREGSTFTYNMV